MSSSTIRTEVRGLDLSLDGSVLSLSAADKELVAPVVLSPEDAALLRLEMAKALLFRRAYVLGLFGFDCLSWSYSFRSLG